MSYPGDSLTWHVPMLFKSKLSSCSALKWSPETLPKAIKDLKVQFRVGLKEDKGKNEY